MKILPSVTLGCTTVTRKSILNEPSTLIPACALLSTASDDWVCGLVGWAGELERAG